MLNARTGTRGDQIVEVSVQAPVVQDERTKELLREYAGLHPDDIAPDFFRSSLNAFARPMARKPDYTAGSVWDWLWLRVSWQHTTER